MIDSILNQDINIDNYEIIIADGMSNDGTRKIIKEYQTYNDNIKIIDNIDKIVSIGFNKALTIAKGDVIIRVDGHAKLYTDFINNCLNAFYKMQVDCVGGVTKHIGRGVIGSSINIAQSSSFGSGGASFRKNITEGEFVDTVAFGAYKRSVFLHIGGYDEELIRNQDDEFNFRLVQNGGKIWLDPFIKSSYYTRSSFLKLFKQYFQYGYYKVRVFQKRGGIASIRQIVPFIFTFSLIILISIYLINGNYKLLFSTIGSYMVLSLYTTLIKMFSKNNSLTLSAFLIPVAFIVMHLSYGMGMLVGFIYFINKWQDTEVKDNSFNSNYFSENVS